METVDLSKDPYIMKNHLGSFECKLCLTLHSNEGSYLAHTQGKKHQQNLGRRAAKLAKEVPGVGGSVTQTIVSQPKSMVSKPRIGIPEHYVFKTRHPLTKQAGMLFILKFPRIDKNSQPRIRLMSAVEQRIEPADLSVQYLLFAAEPYNVVSFKIPNRPLETSNELSLMDWNGATKIFSYQIHFSNALEEQDEA